MTPTIVLKNGRPVLVTGSPGASRIITTALQIIISSIDLKLPVDEAVAATAFIISGCPTRSRSSAACRPT